MSKNDTVLIIRLLKDDKYIWIVLHVQAHECFGNDKWTRWWLFQHTPQRYTLRERKARLIASSMNDYYRPEYGVVLFHSDYNIDDFCLKGGKLTKSDTIIEEPPNNYDTSSPNKWITIEQPIR